MDYKNRYHTFESALKPNQWQIVLPPNGLPDSDEFPIDIIITLIQHTTTLPPPSGGWTIQEPHRRDKTTAAAIISARNLLKYISSACPVLLDERSFNEIWNNLSDTAFALCGSDHTDFSTFKQKLLQHRGRTNE